MNTELKVTEFEHNTKRYCKYYLNNKSEFVKFHEFVDRKFKYIRKRYFLR